jgi:CRISPR/Cas system CSM-associated protein Csm2 small subunit
MKMVPGVIDHHHPGAEAECAASLVAKYPHLVLNHLGVRPTGRAQDKTFSLTLITHRLPDFDAICSIFLALRLVETGGLDEPMRKLAEYAKIVDSASLPKSLDLASTPNTILRALFARIRRRDEEENNSERVREGLKFMRFLYARAQEGKDLLQNRQLFTGVDRYERAMRRAEEDYFQYLEDLRGAEQAELFLPLAPAGSRGRRKVDGLFVQRGRSFLLKEWARLDRIHPCQNKGFTFLLSSAGPGRFMLGVDVEHGVTLRGLGQILDGREAEVRNERGLPFENSWYDGNCAFFENRIVVSPRDGTVLGYEDVVEEVKKFSTLTRRFQGPAF